MRNEPRKIEYSIFYTVRSRNDAGVAFQSTKGQLRNNSLFFSPLVQFLPNFAASIAPRVARARRLLAGPKRLAGHVAIVYVTLGAIGTYEYLRSDIAVRVEIVRARAEK